MRRKCAAGICLVFLLLITPVCALEETTITYLHADIGDVHRYWYGQGEFTASDPGGTYSLHLNGNQLTSYATDAEITRFDPGSLEFRSLAPGSELHCLFTTSKPEGHGLFTAEISVPYISEEPVTRQVRIQIEDAGRVLYLNGPVFFEDERFLSQGSLKTIDLTTGETEFTILYVTQLASEALSLLAGFSIVIFALLGMIVYRRRWIASAVRHNLNRISPGGHFPLRCEESETGIRFALSLPREFFSGLRGVIGREHETIHITLPWVFIASLSVLLILYLIIWGIVTPMMASSFEGVLPGVATTIVSLGFILVVVVLTSILLISVGTVQQLIHTIAVLVGSIILIGLSGILGLYAIPIAIIAGFFINWLAMIVVIDCDDKS